MGNPTKPNKEQWRDYLVIQKSGITNMLATNVVCEYSNNGLTRDMCLYIYKHYEELMKEYDLTMDDIPDEEVENLI